MLRAPTFFAALSLSLAFATGCATYKQDLNRGQAHYDQNHYEQALALFRVLEADIDSLEPGDRTRYAYLRGMTDYRLASIAPKGSAMADPRASFRSNARHWLAVAAAMDKQTPGGITDEEKKRLTDALDELNAEVYGGAEEPSDKADDKSDKADDKSDKADDKSDKADEKGDKAAGEAPKRAPEDDKIQSK